MTELSNVSSEKGSGGGSPIEPTQIESIDVKDLYVDSVTIKPKTFDWSEGYTETWDVIFPTDLAQDAEDDHMPMMNYYYKLPTKSLGSEKGYNSDDAAKLDGLPLTIVHLIEDEEDVLVLSGGGMNFSWEICEAFIRLGFLPPMHFCDLPAMADKYKDPDTLKIIEACRRSADVSGGWAERTKETLDNLANKLREVKA